MIEARESDQALRADRRCGPAELRCAAGGGDRLPRPERIWQVHHDAIDARPGSRRPRPKAASMAGGPRAALAAARGRDDAGGQGVPPGPYRARRICAPWRRATTSTAVTGGRGARHRRACTTRPAAARASSRWGWRNAWASLPRCSAIPACSSSTSRRTALIRQGIRWIRGLLKSSGRARSHRARLQPPDRRDGPAWPTTRRHRAGRLLADTSVAALSARSDPSRRPSSSSPTGPRHIRRQSEDGSS